MDTFHQTLSEAIRDLSETGYDSADRIDAWVNRLRNAAERAMGVEYTIDQETARRLGAIYDRMVDGGKILERVPDVSRYTLAMVRPALRAELDRRIIASVNLIRLDRKRAVEATLDRFRGWSTSIPQGGDETINKTQARVSIGKSIARVKYEQRRVLVDQSHKLIANVAELVATDNGAIAGIWHDHGEHDVSYNARKEHMARAGKIYLVRDSWAHRQGLVKPVNGYMDEITRPGQEVMCRCFYQWLTSPRRLPDEFLTAKGQEFVARKAAA